MSDYPMLISNKLHSFRNFYSQKRPLNVCKMKQATEFRSFLNSYLLNKNNKRTI